MDPEGEWRCLKYFRMSLFLHVWKKWWKSWWWLCWEVVLHFVMCDPIDGPCMWGEIMLSVWPGSCSAFLQNSWVTLKESFGLVQSAAPLWELLVTKINVVLLPCPTEILWLVYLHTPGGRITGEEFWDSACIFIKDWSNFEMKWRRQKTALYPVIWMAENDELL